MMRRLHSGVVAIGAQVFQAGSSFALQIIAAWLLGSQGLALISLCLGVIIIATAASSGVVGDSLTVLDRRSAAVRGGLTTWLVVLALAAAVVGGLTLRGLGFLSSLGALTFAGALVLFMVEDIMRRLHVAALRFWPLFAIDGSALVGTLSVIVVAHAAGLTSVTSFLAAMGVGQAVGAAVGWMRLPSGDRGLGRMRLDGVREVGAYGLWRGAQVALTPATQTAVRFVLINLTGAAALGQVEAGRIYIAPAMLSVQGFGAYLFARYARSDRATTAQLAHLATRSAAGLGAFAAAMGLVAWLLLPSLGWLISGPRFDIDPVVVAGWTCVAIATACLQPFSSLAAARGAQRRVFSLRAVDATATPAVLALALSQGWLGASHAPFVVAAGLLVAGILIRRFALGTLIAGERRERTWVEYDSKGTNARQASAPWLSKGGRAMLPRPRGLPPVTDVQKPMSGAPAYSRYVNRPLGRRIALRCYVLGLSPNQVTAVSAAITGVGLVLIATAPPYALAGVLVTALLAFGYAFDSADGQVARMRGGGSPVGEWLDHIVDAVKTSSIHLLVAIHLYRFTDVPALALLVPLAYSVVHVTFFFGHLLTDFLRRLHPTSAPPKQTSAAVWRSLVALPADYGVLCLVFVLLPWPRLFLPVYTLLAVGYGAFLAAALVRWWRGFTHAAGPGTPPLIQPEGG